MNPGLACIVAMAWLLAASAGAHPADSLEERIVAVSEAVTPSVVHISSVVRVNDRRNVVTGSGLIARADGLVLTNQHVVDKAVKVEVTVPGRKRRYPAEIVGTDPQTDLAVLRISSDEPLPAATFGKVDDVRVGQWVLAIGNPYGLDGTVSLGIVSAKGRNLEVPGLLNDFIQTDAMIDRGSSGGPLVDLEGRVIGLNSRGQGRGIGFTIPVDTVLQVMAELENGGVERGWLGTSIQALSRELASYLGVPDATGVIVNGVSEGSPAARAGLRAGDVMTGFGEQDVDAEKDEDLGKFQRQVAATAPGTEVRLQILRDGRFRKVNVTIGTQPKVEPEEEETDLGFHVQEITEGLYRSERLPVREGVFVAFVAPGSPAARANLFIGDVIVDIDGHEIEDLGDLRRAVARAEDQRRVLIRARRGKDLRFLLLDRGAPSSTKSEAKRASDPTAE
ncbi:MAG: trypsin-like peptidase domain-containing protein [Deltaproteobacteria bacterium]|nr:trypsin-like peptidase domain-containing protein [Deltaproteobacteria bacterium]